MLDNLTLTFAIKILISLCLFIFFTIFIVFKIKNKKTNITLVGKSEKNIINNSIGGDVIINNEER